MDTTPELGENSQQRSPQDADPDLSDDEIPEPPVGEDTGGAEVIQQLEKNLQQWPGFGEEGWSTEMKPVRPLPIISHRD